MLDLSPDKMWEEVQAAETVRDMFLSSFDEMVEKRQGPAYREDKRLSGDSEWDPENHAHEVLSLVKPEIVFTNPKVRIKTRRPGPQRKVARAIHNGENRWIRDSRLYKVLDDIADDMMFKWGACVVERVPTDTLGRDDNERTYRPYVEHLDLDRFGFDPLGGRFRKARYVFHRTVEDKEDLLEKAKDQDSGWDADAIESLTATVEHSKAGRDKDTAEKMPERDEIVYYDIWIAEVNDLSDFGIKHPGPEAGYHGSWFTLAVTPGEKLGAGEKGSMRTAFIRKPRPFYGPRTGPYVLFGVYSVRKSAFPLGPLTATQPQADSLNEIARAIDRGCGSYKRQVIVSGNNPALAKALKENPHDEIVIVKGFEKGQIETAETGGVQNQQLVQFEFKKDELDRNSGMSDSRRGNAQANVTATADAIANQAGDKRVAYMKQRFTAGVVELLTIVAWYLYHDDRVQFALGEEAASEQANELRAQAEQNPELAEFLAEAESDSGVPIDMLMDPWFFGGLHEEGSGATFEDLELEIEPYSMEHLSEGLLQRNTAMAVEFIMNTAPIMPQTPWVKWGEVYSKLGDSLNMPDFADLVDIQMAMQFAGLQMQAAMADPTLAGDAGVALGGGKPQGGTPQIQTTNNSLGGKAQSPVNGQTNGQARGSQLNGASRA